MGTVPRILVTLKGGPDPPKTSEVALSSAIGGVGNITVTCVQPQHKLRDTLSTVVR